ncbi:MAG: O-acetylhomoserine aminocarboxypropyltransferase/cysteine synthase [Planctomycetia bacterium]|nr:O-acetylhomoserine aminocarboxypropyltransferase/cysteine synthase [Planctomycetia bacterium]
MKKYHLETLAVQAGQERQSETQAMNTPIFRTTAFPFRNAEHCAALFALKESGNIYARLMNPTNDVLEKRLAALDGGQAAVTLSSGTAAIYFTITNLATCGEEIVAANNLYGGTFTLFDAILPQQGITVRFTNVNDFDAVEAAINDKTRAIYVETVGNPTLEVADLERYAAVAQKHHLPLVVDATFTPPTLLRPLAYGANIVIHSLSKWIGGHGAGIGGVVIDAGNFDWTDARFTLYNTPDRGYHGLRFAHDLGENAVPFATRLRTVGLRNQGPTLGPDAAWTFLQGVESLPLRMARHSENAQAVAEFLQNHPRVAWVRYPGFQELGKKYLPWGAGGMVVFGVKGDSRTAMETVDRLTLFRLAANVGETRSLVIHPASSTHSQLSDEAQRTAGVSPEMIRLSVGLEHIDDLLDDLRDAL